MLEWLKLNRNIILTSFTLTSFYLTFHLKPFKKWPQYLCSISYHFKKEAKDVLYAVFKKTVGFFHSSKPGKKLKIYSRFPTYFIENDGSKHTTFYRFLSSKPGTCTLKTNELLLWSTIKRKLQKYTIRSLSFTVSRPYVIFFYLHHLLDEGLRCELKISFLINMFHCHSTMLYYKN